MPPLNRDSGSGTRRRLEDVSHFFLDTNRAKPPNAVSSVTLNSCLAPRERSNGRARIVHLVSVAHDISGAMVVAGLAALLARSGMRVLVAEATAHPFDAAFALGVFRADPVHRRPIAETRSGVGLLTAPLVGSTLPPVYLQPDDLRAVQDRLRGADLVFVHLGRGKVARVQPEIAPPDELIVVVPDAGPEAQLDAYRAIKEVVHWNSEVRIGVIAAGASAAIGRPLSRLTEAVERFLRRDCSVIGCVPDASTLAAHFLSGAFLDAGGDEIARVLGPIAGRWMRPSGSQRSSVTPDGNQRSSIALDGSPERTRSPSAAREATIFRHARIDLDGLTATAHPSGLAGAFSPPRRRPGIQDCRDPGAGKQRSSVALEGNPSPSHGRGPAPA